jgi:hypothetical protein
MRGAALLTPMVQECSRTKGAAGPNDDYRVPAKYAASRNMTQPHRAESTRREDSRQHVESQEHLEETM